MNKVLLLICFLVFAFTLSVFAQWDDPSWSNAERNGDLAQDAFMHCRDFVRGWLSHADPQTGLIPRNLNGDDYWNAKDAAADNYPFMVLTSSLLDQSLFHGTMRDMLATETLLTCRVGSLPDDYAFATQSFRRDHIDMSSIIFGASEYVKDGLMPLTEWLGTSPWQQRMLDLVDGILANASVETPVGVLPATDHEVGGEMMQILCRMYWMTGKEQYRSFALRYGDYFLFHASPIKVEKLSLDDHGCEVIGGLSEVYLLASYTDADRHRKYKKPMYEILDTILKYGRNENGLFFSKIDPRTGKIFRDELTDNWGYDYNAFLTVAHVDRYEPYREAVEFALQNVHKHTGYPWERDGSDGYADSIESGLNLLNRIPVPSGFEWVEHEIAHMLAKQGKDGVIEGWHGDGNYARTAIMFALWKTQGCRIHPWRADVSLGAIEKEGELWITVRSKWPWKGKIMFDRPRHKEVFNMPVDYPRLNQFPEWFVVEKEQDYEVSTTLNPSDKMTRTGKQLQSGFEIHLPGKTNRGLEGKSEARMVVKPLL